ncbi:MAG: 4Fe-4S dicluster domain-containing protein, partial [Alphaproteobacteria bacterium]|nr:4Fe-4S dicluster domain-containing protein [Alphaproteobacteria bacterium]
GEHGDGIVRSEFHGPMFGQRMVAAFETAKAIFDPKELLNPGKIVRPYRMDDRTLLRYPPGYAHLPVKPGLDWSAWGGFPHAVEMCNNNGECRKATGGVMCPSFRVTAEEKDSTRGRANTLRLALSGQLGPAALLGEAMAETLKLCVGCKGCKRECPTGVDMARMKIEVLHQRNERRGVPLAERVVASLPRWAAWAQRLRGLARLRDSVPGLAWLSERLLGFSARRSLPIWSAEPFRPGEEAATNPVAPSGAVALLADTFNIWFEPENLRAAVRVLQAANLTVTVAAPPDGERPLCCGRTYLAAGMVEEARGEMRRTAAALAPLLAQGMPVLGLEPSCLMTFRDELLAVLPGRESEALSKRAFLLEEYLAAEAKAGRLALPLRALPEATALLHGHCHQKAFGAMGAVEQVLRLVPGLAVKTVDSSCCGMAGAFGYRAETIDASFAMGELSLLPAVRTAAPGALVVADGTSCRHQIHDGAGRAAVHVAIVLERALAATGAR